MSAVVHSISENPRLRIACLVQLLVARQELAAIDEMRSHLPLDDPDRHDLDRVDTACGRMTITTPDADVVTAQRRTALLRAVKAEGGRWKSGRAVRLYEHLGYGHLGQGTAARDLLHLAAAGHLARYEGDGCRYFTLRGDDRA
ncbi:hypothetical protein AB0N17_03375 [Streptomyces sp. NPDC051133]|uniref:hypothetical protein n=1 Tax=Streptomyces sp. NPDC051133 TaxID=3155521 RepID=UPI0034308CAE